MFKYIFLVYSFFLLLRRSAIRISLLFYTFYRRIYILRGCTHNTLSSGTFFYRPYKGVPFPPETRRRRIRETLESVSTFSSGELLHAVMSRSGLQGTPEIDIKLAVGQ